MPSFESILDRPASEIKPPPAYPVGTYHCLVDGPPVVGKSKNQNDFFTFKFKVLKAMEDVNQQEAAEQQMVGKTFTNDTYVTVGGGADDQSWRLKEFLGHLGIEDAGKSLREMLAEAPGKQVLVKLKHQLSEDGKRVFHRVESTAHV